MKYEYEDLEEFIKGIKDAGIKRAGMTAAYKNEPGAPLMLEGRLVPSRQIGATILLSAADEDDHHMTHIQAAEELITSEEEAQALEKKVVKLRDTIIETLQKEAPEVVIFAGKVLP